MTIFETIKNKSIDEYVEWLYNYCRDFDNAPWWDWFDDTYCKKCDGVIIKPEESGYHCDIECAWCEINNKCKFFEEMDNVPDAKQIIKMWLLSEC